MGFPRSKSIPSSVPFGEDLDELTHFLSLPQMQQADHLDDAYPSAEDNTMKSLKSNLYCLKIGAFLHANSPRRQMRCKASFSTRQRRTQV